MTAPFLNNPVAKCQRLSHLFVVALGLHLLGTGNSVASERQGDPILLIAPSFERPPISRYLPGSKRTLITPALMQNSGESLPLGANALKTPEEWDLFIKGARERSSLQLATLNPEMIRDDHGIIQMAVINSESPLNASCILASGFLQHFSAIFGPELLLAIPTRNKIYIFPKLANHLQEMTGAIRDQYLISPMPVSTEIFELSRNGLRAIGSLDPDNE